MMLMSFAPVAEHLLESTAFLLCVWGFASLLSRHAAAVRYRLWLAASLKFMVPLAPLVALGRRFAWRTAPIVHDAWTGASNIQMPAAAGHGLTAAAAHLPDASASFAALLLAVWAAGSLLLLARWCASVRRVRTMIRQAARADAATLGVPRRVRALATPRACEPAIVGVWRPALVLPADIASRLTRAQLDSVIAHEMCHLGRRDNLAAAAHMVVEVLFWFHPGVWLVERRLVDERERACDEAVVGAGAAPETYAEAILQVCRHYISAPTIAHAAVTGAGLRERIERIVRNPPAVRLEGWRRVALLAGAALVVMVPMAAGAATGAAVATQASATAPNAEREAFDTVSIKPVPPTMRSGWKNQPGRMSGTFTVKTLIALAFATGPTTPFPDNRIVGGPDWIDTALYAINATAPRDGKTDDSNPIAFGRPLFPLFRPMLEDRFRLSTHMERRELPVYALVIARGDGRLGPKLHPSPLTSDDCRLRMQHPDPSLRPLHCGTERRGTGFTAVAQPLLTIVNMAGGPFDRNVRDETGLNGLFDADVDREDGVSPFTIVQEQLGLKLEPRTEPLDVIVVDHIERPTPD